MFKIILAQNRQRAIEGLNLLDNNIKILENSKVKYDENKINLYKKELKTNKIILQNDNVSMEDIDKILTFVDITNQVIMDKFN